MIFERTPSVVSFHNHNSAAPLNDGGQSVEELKLNTAEG